MVRIEPTAEASLAEILARIRFGMAIAAMIRMIATTIRSSISEKPFCFFISSLKWLPRPLRAFDQPDTPFIAASVPIWLLGKNVALTFVNTFIFSRLNQHQIGV